MRRLRCQIFRQAKPVPRRNPLWISRGSGQHNGKDTSKLCTDHFGIGPKLARRAWQQASGVAGNPQARGKAAIQEGAGRCGGRAAGAAQRAQNRQKLPKNDGLIIIISTKFDLSSRKMQIWQFSQ